MDNNPKRIKIGIAFEGNRDIKPLEILIKRILLPQYQPIFIKSITPHTGLIGYIKVYIKHFFEADNPVDIAVFVTDQDKQNKSVKRIIVKKINEVNVTYRDLSVIGVPTPHFEAWLVADEGQVKYYFSLPGTRPIDIINFSAKLTLEHLQRNMNDPQVPLFQVYKDLANTINLRTISLLRIDFKDFVNQLQTACKRIK